MQPICSQCGFTAETGAKFCRQCGAPLGELGSTEAKTMQYGRQTPNAPHNPANPGVPSAAPATSQMPPQAAVPPSIGDTFANDTARLHNQAPAYGQPPAPANYQVGPAGQAYGAPVGYAPQPAVKSNWWKWVLGIVLSLVLLCGGAASYLFYSVNRVVKEKGGDLAAAIERAQKEIEKAQQNNGTTTTGPDGVPVPPQPPPAPGTEAATAEAELQKLRYPNLVGKTNTVRALGNLVVTTHTKDTYEQIKAFYVKQLGKPMVETNAEEGETGIFQSEKFMVTVSPAKRADAAYDITITTFSISGMLKGMGEGLKEIQKELPKQQPY